MDDIPKWYPLKERRGVKAFICKNPKYKNGDHKIPKQFILITSYEFKQLIFNKLKSLYEALLKDSDNSKTLAKKFKVSASQISALRAAFVKVLNKLEELDILVKMPQANRAICMDETFLKIEGIPIHLIIAMGYKTHKILGLKVPMTRNEKDMRKVVKSRTTSINIKNLTKRRWQGITFTRKPSE